MATMRSVSTMATWSCMAVELVYTKAKLPWPDLALEGVAVTTPTVPVTHLLGDEARPMRMTAMMPMSVPAMAPMHLEERTGGAPVDAAGLRRCDVYYAYRIGGLHVWCRNADHGRRGDEEN